MENRSVKTTINITKGTKIMTNLNSTTKRESRAAEEETDKVRFPVVAEWTRLIISTGLLKIRVRKIPVVLSKMPRMMGTTSSIKVVEVIGKSINIMTTTIASHNSILVAESSTHRVTKTNSTRNLPEAAAQVPQLQLVVVYITTTISKWEIVNHQKMAVPVATKVEQSTGMQDAHNTIVDMDNKLQLSRQ